MKQLNQYRLSCAQKQKRGLHFILASVIIWSMISFVYLSSLPILTKNLFTFICTGSLLPISFLISKIINVDFQNKENPLSNVGFLFSMNQLPYLLIAMWIYPTIPEKMIMVITIIFGAHLLPFSWLYKSKIYLIFSIIIPLLALIIGLSFAPAVLSMIMIGVELSFCVLLSLENKNLNFTNNWYHLTWLFQNKRSCYFWWWKNYV